MRFILIFFIVALLFLLGTVLIMDANRIELGEGWYLVPTPDSWR